MEKLDCRTLMIGDWVLIGNNHIMVTSLQEGRDYVEAQPIRLTAEILRRNFTDNNECYGLFDDYFDFDIREFNDGSFLVRYHSCEMNLPDEQIIISYVHQLQHFMSHCAIEKEIVL